VSSKRFIQAIDQTLRNEIVAFIADNGLRCSGGTAFNLDAENSVKGTFEPVLWRFFSQKVTGRKAYQGNLAGRQPLP
jgi:hypothetical protein